MREQDQEIVQLFVEESREHLAEVERELLAAEAAGGDAPPEVVNKVFRSVHSIKGGAGFLGLSRVKDLSHELENVVGLMREHRLAPSPAIITALLRASDRLRELVERVEESNGMEIAPVVAALQGLLSPAGAPPAPPPGAPPATLSIPAPEGAANLCVAVEPLFSELASGKFIYLVELDPADPGLQDLDPASALRDIGKGGVILAPDPETTLGGGGGPGFPPCLLFASLLEPGLVTGVLPVEERRIHDLTPELTARLGAARGPLAEPPEPPPETARAGDSPAPGGIPAHSLFEPRRAPEREPARVPEDPAHAPSAPEKPLAETSLRVQVSLLDRLMTLTGELVLGRNRLLQALGAAGAEAFAAVAQKLDLVTSELQETVMLTRMQPVGLVFSKFPRTVRDLALTLGKEAALAVEGNDVELDKTIIEGLHDPLTHLVRNAVDHGIEPTEVRRRLGKTPTGNVLLKASHQAGLVVIEISDDGKGLDPAALGRAAVAKGRITAAQNLAMTDRERLNLVFQPGFSTAEKITEVSGRGVGLDVVKSNLDRLGGQVEIDSRVGEGTTFRIKLPLTLAIIPCLLVSAAGERFALPQVNVQELLRIPAERVGERVERVGDAELVRLRGDLLPLVPLAGVVGLARGAAPGAGDGPQGEPGGRGGPSPGAGGVSIAVLRCGTLVYGLVVDAFHGVEEIVIKPLGGHLKGCRAYAGATIMGDGRVALILDAANLAGLAAPAPKNDADRAEERAQEPAARASTDIHSLLLFHQGEREVFAVPLFLVERLEKIRAGALECMAGQRVIRYRGGSLPVFGLDELLPVATLDGREDLVVLVCAVAGREVGFLAAPPVDTFEGAVAIDHQTLSQPAVMGSAIIGEEAVLILDVIEFLERRKPEWFTGRPKPPESAGEAPLVLLAEDSTFFRSQVKRFMTEAGYRVLEAEDGEQALALLEKNVEAVRVVVTDIEMPNLDGLGLTARIKADARLRHLPVIALTSLAGEEDLARGREAGVDDYQVKLDRERLLESLALFLSGNETNGNRTARRGGTF